ncbi:helix-turn-helix domain-containing protein [Candidatus Parcubacteria bacterium]|nr:MAG: helix-turn-helix domain-containing protein [Candidatus Parcubacteria bacterium]
MSVRVMSLVFDAPIDDIEYTDSVGKKHKLKASTAKLVLLAYADHSNDVGEAAYPSIKRLMRKTALTRRGLQKAISALVQSNYLLPKGTSRLGTNDFKINVTLLLKKIEDANDGKSE